MDWNNIDFSNDYERDARILDPISFEDVILQISCNVPKQDTNEQTVQHEFDKALNAAIDSAREVFAANLESFTAHILKD